jgi:uncharacterized protein (DUF433 family)
MTRRDVVSPPFNCGLSATRSRTIARCRGAALDRSECSAVESVPGKVSGAWVFKGTRLPLATVIENLEDLSIDEVIEQFDVTREQIAAVLEFVAQSLRASDIPAGS